MRSASVLFRDRCQGVLLSGGSGSSGVAGMGTIAEAGGETYVQDRKGAVAPQLATEALEAGVARRELSLSDLSQVLV